MLDLKYLRGPESFAGGPFSIFITQSHLDCFSKSLTLKTIAKSMVRFFRCCFRGSSQHDCETVENANPITLEKKDRQEGSPFSSNTYISASYDEKPNHSFNGTGLAELKKYNSAQIHTEQYRLSRPIQENNLPSAESQPWTHPSDFKASLSTIRTWEMD